MNEIRNVVTQPIDIRIQFRAKRRFRIDAVNIDNNSIERIIIPKGTIISTFLGFQVIQPDGVVYSMYSGLYTDEQHQTYNITITDFDIGSGIVKKLAGGGKKRKTRKLKRHHTRKN